MFVLRDLLLPLQTHFSNTDLDLERAALFIYTLLSIIVPFTSSIISNCWRCLETLFGIEIKKKCFYTFMVSSIYAALKKYKKKPDEQEAARLRKQFQNLCATRTDYETLNSLLKRMANNEHELFRVLDRPEIPLHNNLSERDIRDYVKKRKISGSTRSDTGRKCRDTFASLKKTCRKHGISFWDYLIDRTSGSNLIPSMAEILQAAAC